MKERPRFTQRVVFLAPVALEQRIEQAAERELMTTSEFIRRAVIARLNGRSGYEHSEAA